MMHLISCFRPTTRSVSLGASAATAFLFSPDWTMNLVIGWIWLTGLWLMFAMTSEAEAMKQVGDASKHVSFEGKNLNCWNDYDDDITEITMDESLQLEEEWEEDDDDLRLFKWEYD